MDWLSMGYGGFGPGPANVLILNKQFLRFFPYKLGNMDYFSYF